MFKASLTSKILIRKNLNNTGDKNYSYLFVINRADILSVCVCLCLSRSFFFFLQINCARDISWIGCCHRLYLGLCH